MEKQTQATLYETKSYTRVKGVALVLTGAILWGVSGTVAQFLFQHLKVNVEWLSVLRMLVSGILLLGLCYKKERSRIWGIWADKSGRISIILFGLIGMLGVQYTYFAAIDHSNAATATVLQSLGPVIITCYLAVNLKRLPNFMEIAAVGLAVLGTFFLVTHGNIHRLSVSGLTLFWGLSSAFAAAFYTLQPRKLLRKWGSVVIVGWGMLIGGVGLSFVHPPWIISGEFSLYSIASIAFIIIFGTLVAFFCYLESLNYLSASETSILATAEPLSAAILSVLWLRVSFGFFDYLGALFVISTIFILAMKNR
ncbi:DMT family transporter [Sporolactobacillus laevolacticus]|uniref:DMT family transporter n=1 Tax=Sporolactobacillus laevolacticus TaxID=33018 RepID=UPI0025B55849|nr:DMT family transporter [Sporolactobacillus laevolacticus]MDN3954488.1 DMT family transporter [Sporolactobacillus laevolacticus]